MAKTSNIRAKITDKQKRRYNSFLEKRRLEFGKRIPIVRCNVL